MTKVLFSSHKTQRFGGLNLLYTFPLWKKMGQMADDLFGERSKSGYGYKYSEVLSHWFSSVLCGGTHIEDVNIHRREAELMPDAPTPSADTVLRAFEELSVQNVQKKCPQSGITYNFNRNKKLNGFLMDTLLASKLITTDQEVVLDYDNQILATEKYDSKMTYKKCQGYFFGNALLNSHLAYIEGRDGNAPVVFDQVTTISNILEMCKERGIKVGKARMDCGSYLKDVISLLDDNEILFYIRASNSKYTDSIVNEVKRGWKKLKLDNGRKLEVMSRETDEFVKGRTFRLVIYRERDEDYEDGLFQELKYRRFCIITSDWTSSEKEIIEFYNKRGGIERVFDQMNNDFNWSHLPSSEMKNNTVMMILMAVLRNFYTCFVRHLAVVTKGLFKANKRLKAFIYDFLTCPAEWVIDGEGRTLWLHYDSLILRRYVRHCYRE